MSRSAQIIVAVVWIVVLFVFWVDARRYITNQPWSPHLVLYDFGVGVAATVVVVVADRLIRRGRR
jgi:hypothetical protein